jgi:malonate decarboxylase alpha subunit
MSATSREGTDRAARLARAAKISSGKLCPANRATDLLEAIIAPGDRVTIEGDNQKQADFLAAALAKADPARLHDLHMVQSVLALPDHLAVFERGIANRLDFAFAGPQSRKLAELVTNGTVKIGAIHTYLELYARMLVDLTPRVALIVADKADRNGNLYTGPNTETRRPLPKLRPFAAASSWRRSMRSSTDYRASTSPATGSTSSCRARSLTPSSLCSRATPPR